MKKRDAKRFGRRLVACSAWRWMPGMLKIGGARQLGYSMDASLSDLPDLRDSATQGCVQDLVLENEGVIDERSKHTHLTEECELWVRSLEELGALVSAVPIEDVVTAAGCLVTSWELDSHTMTISIPEAVAAGDELDMVIDGCVYQVRAERAIPANTPIPLMP